MKQSTSRRMRILKRVVVYFIMTSAVIFTSTVLVFLLLGYRFNKDIGTFQQGGLVQFDTQPDDARVTVGMAQLADKTPSKITLYPGEYLVKMELDGYQGWQKDIAVVSGKVLRLDSALFVPLQPETSSVLELPKLSSMTTRTNGKRIALASNAKTPSFELIDIRSDTPEFETVRLPTGTFSAAKQHGFKLKSWASDDRHLLVHHSFGTASEWLVVDVDEPASTRIIPAAENVRVASVQFDPSSFNRVYVRYVDKSVRRMNVDSGELSPVLATDVADLSLTSSGTMLFTSVPDKGVVTLAYISRDRSEVREIESVRSSSAVQIAGGQYFDTFYIAYSLDEETTVLSLDGLPGSDSESPLRSEKLTVKGGNSPVVDLDFKAGGRILAAQYGRSLQVYDNDIDAWSMVPLVGQKSLLKTPVQWIDNFHFWNGSTGFMRQYEFDGTNQASITRVAKGFEAVYSPNKKYLYTVGQTKDGYELQRTLMILKD